MGELSSTSHICFVVCFITFNVCHFFAVKCHMSFQFLYYFMGNGEILKSPILILVECFCSMSIVTWILAQNFLLRNTGSSSPDLILVLLLSINVSFLKT